MDREKLRQQMKVEMDRVVEQLAGEAPEALEDMASMERKIYAACDAIKAKYLQAWINSAREQGARPACPHCGGKLRQKERVKKTLSAVGGQVDVGRTRWWCNACKASFFPSGPDNQCGELPGHPRGRKAGGSGDG